MYKDAEAIIEKRQNSAKRVLMHKRTSTNYGKVNLAPAIAKNNNSLILDSNNSRMHHEKRNSDQFNHSVR